MKELNFDNYKEFKDSRTEYIDKFSSNCSIFRRKITQGLYWTSLDKDLANQVLRDERWFLGIKFWDALKLINHGADDANKNNIGFKK
jgi:hypothetical protein